MKLQVITYTRTKNYGGILQAYGLYSYLVSCGHAVSFIDYVPERCNVEDVQAFGRCVARQSRFWGRNAVTQLLWRKIEYPRVLNSYGPFRDFLDSRCTFTHRYTSCDELMADPPQGDVFITGSDQVWNSGFTSDGKIDRPFYLPFANGRRVSYASSFGNSTIPKENAAEVKSLLSQYSHLSVREQSGLRILESLGLNGTVACDPTLLCDSAVWEGLAAAYAKKDYILLYQISPNEGVLRAALEVAHAKNKPLVVACLDSRRRYPRECSIVTPTIEEWLGYIKFADAVITDSFHASVFSVIFHVPFLVSSGTRRNMASRITDLLEVTGLTSRELYGLSSAEVIEALSAKIDWDNVEQRINNTQQYSRDWLKGAING